jgi:hypothetical protein
MSPGRCSVCIQPSLAMLGPSWNSRGGQRVVTGLRAIEARGIPRMHIGCRSYTISAVNPQISAFCMPEKLPHTESKSGFISLNCTA